MFQRYAIYVTPDEQLASFGAAWLGWDMQNGQTVPHPDVFGLDIAEITKRPRKYGLHATIKPPMVLADEKSCEELIQATGAVAKRIDPVVLDGLVVSRLGRFLALTVEGDTGALGKMAAKVIKELDPFRATPSADDLNRRRQRTLTPSQEQNLQQWGYPHVMDDFRFHITLTGTLKDAGAVMQTVAAHFRPALPAPFVVDHLTIAGEDADGMFHSIARIKLGA